MELTPPGTYNSNARGSFACRGATNCEPDIRQVHKDVRATAGDNKELNTGKKHKNESQDRN